MRRPPCPAVRIDEEGTFTCVLRRWHRGLHSSFPPGRPTRRVELMWSRDWRTPVIRVLDAVERWFTIPRLEPIEDWDR
jgi:hypothetical protein